jgi:hypothetical protein
LKSQQFSKHGAVRRKAQIMEKAFWQNRWQEGKIGFHEGVPNR